jgi:acetoacetyl-[acyl-carrier protein] synthase
MKKLPLIVGMGGINCAGRSSGFHSYKRMICDALDEATLANTWLDLANRMGIAYAGEPGAAEIAQIKDGTLLRRIESFDPDHIDTHLKANLSADGGSATFVIHKSKMPESIPDHWQCEALDDGNGNIKVTTSEPVDILLPSTYAGQVTSAGNIPRGFDPSALYKSRHHPRGLTLGVYGASDLLNSLGLEWETILSHIKPDQISVYAGSAICQVDEHSLSGLVAEPLRGNRINSKMVAMSLAEMPADFINSYIINSIGNTGTNMGACATFLYNLKQGIMDIENGRARVAIIGNAESAVVPEIVEGFRQMGALAKDEHLCALDNTDKVDNRRACRPFANNGGFTVAEAAQFVMIMDDELALELGANIYGCVSDVFINADANKRSISSPGIGNYVTVAKAAALANAILGDGGLARSFVLAHGTGTPQNRVTESHILNEVAKTFGLSDWKVAAIKSYLGHSISAAAGDQMMTALGVWQHGFIPGIKTIDHVADDVHQSHLNFLLDHAFVGDKGCEMDAAILNAKGFGGNNASGLVLSPAFTHNLLKRKHSSDALKQYQSRNEAVSAACAAADLKACQGDERIIYKFGESVMDETSISMTKTSLSLSEFEHSVDLPTEDPYKS